MQSEYDNSLQSYFTDMEHLRVMFKEFVVAEKLPKRLIVFHGVGGVGKSSLLRMFRLHCKSEKIPVALASGDDTKSVLDVVTRWAEDLKEDGIKFPAFDKTMKSYRAIQAKVDDQSQKSQNRIADIASKAASKTAETAGGALLGAAIGSVIPGVGTAIGGALGGVVSGMGAEALTDWLRGFLTKTDIELLLDPAKKLSTDFLEDIAKAAEKKRVALLLDTFEQMSALEDWVGEAVQKIHPNVLVVIAGRKLPDWNRTWSGWMMNAQAEELKPMTEEVMRELIHRYYATMRGGEPDPAQVEAIIKFARGLPMVVTSAVQLWVKYGVEDFQSVKAEIVANLVDRLMEGVPSALIPALEVAAVVRWFDQPILRAVMNKEDVRDVFNELRRFPFVRTRVEGLALHDSVREILDENLHVQDSERHAELHERAAVYFEKRLEKVTGEVAERLGLERLYHCVRADEDNGIKLFQEMAEELTQYRFANRLRALLNDANTYPLEKENSKLWRVYYKGRIAHLEIRLHDAEFTYHSIIESKYADAKLRAYAISDWGQIFEYEKRTWNSEDTPKVIELIKSIPYSGVEIDQKLAISFKILAGIYFSLGDLENGWHYWDEFVHFFQSQTNQASLIYLYEETKIVYSRTQDWRLIFQAQNALEQTAADIQNYSVLRSKALGRHAIFWVFAGRFNEAEKIARESLSVQRQFDEVEIGGVLRDLGLALAYQGKFSEVKKYFEESVKVEQLSNSPIGESLSLCFWGVALMLEGKYVDAENYLNRAVTIRYELKGKLDEPLLYLGALNETQLKLSDATQLYEMWKTLQYPGRNWFKCFSLTGLVRIKHTQGDFTAIPSLLAEAEQLAQQYEYNDHLASLRLTQGHLTFEGRNVVAPSIQHGEETSPLRWYQQAMIYALRYNRFLLDELLSGRPQGTPLHPIIPYCLERGEEGKMLLSALRDWWKTGVNDIGTPRPDTISPIPEGIPLLEAEKLVREREPGDGSSQKSVIEQIEASI